MNYSEYLRRKMESTPKTIAPRPIGDSSLLTQINRYKTTKAPVRGSDGQQQEWSGEALMAAKAGCAVCAAPAPTTVTIPCCGQEAQPTGLAYQGIQRCPCPTAGPPPQLKSPYDNCCPESLPQTTIPNNNGGGYRSDGRPPRT